MEGRHDERERLRAERQAAESQDASAALARKRRVQYLSLAAFGAVAVIVALIVISQSGGDGNSTRRPTSPASRERPGRHRAQGHLAERPDARRLGAQVTVTEFGDPQCPVCKEFAEQIAPQLISSEVRTGNVKFVFEPFLIIGPDSKPAMKAILAAGEQQKFWNYLQLFYANQGGGELRLRHGQLSDEPRQGGRPRHRQVERLPQLLEVGRRDRQGHDGRRGLRVQRHALPGRAGTEGDEDDRRLRPPRDPGGDPAGQLGLP